MDEPIYTQAYVDRITAINEESIKEIKAIYTECLDKTRASYDNALDELDKSWRRLAIQRTIWFLIAVTFIILYFTKS